MCVHDLIVACSMHSGFKFVGVSCSAMSKVSSRGGKYGRRRSTLNIGRRPRNGGILSLKALFPTTLVMVYGSYRSGRSLRWVLVLNLVFLICMSMIQSVVACSMQSGFNSVGVSCFAMFEVSSRGGK